MNHVVSVASTRICLKDPGEAPPWPSDLDSRDGDGSPASFGRASTASRKRPTELDRIILYVPPRILDLAEALAEKAGVPTVQDYCALLLMQALENERIQQKVADFEARRGPLEGLKQIADDPELSGGMERAVRGQTGTAVIYDTG